jgi:hypothetical protein
MISATGNNWNSTETGWKEAEKSLDLAENLQQMIKHGSSIRTRKFSDSFR